MRHITWALLLACRSQSSQPSASTSAPVPSETTAPGETGAVARGSRAAVVEADAGMTRADRERELQEALGRMRPAAPPGLLNEQERLTMQRQAIDMANLLTADGPVRTDPYADAGSTRRGGGNLGLLVEWDAGAGRPRRR